MHNDIKSWNTQQKQAKRVEGREEDAYMFLSFYPLVSLLNSLQVLKMQLHQSIYLERESERCTIKQNDEKITEKQEKTESPMKRQKKRKVK